MNARLMGLFDTTTRRTIPVKTTAVSTFGKLTLAGAFALLSLSQALAEDRADVLERIAPIGKVAVEGQAEPATAVEMAPAAAEPARTTEVEAPAETAEAAPPTEVEAPAAGEDALSLATASGCMACHQVETKVVGPAYKEVAAKYKGDAGALDMLVNKVMTGGSGTWGQIPMPPNAHVGEEKVRAIVQWVLSL
jgi:cytochrome c